MLSVSKVKPKQVEMHAVVRRADGTVEDLGVVAYYHRNPLLRLWHHARHGSGRIILGP